MKDGMEKAANTDFQAVVDGVLKKAAWSSHLVQGEMVYVSPASERKSQRHIMQTLRARGAQEAGDAKRLHVGVAGFFNLDVATITRPDAVLLLDYNKDAVGLWWLALREIDKASRPAAFQASFQRELLAVRISKPELECSFPLTIGQYFAKDALWLKDAGAYRFIRQLVQSGKVYVGAADVLSKGPMAAELGKAIREHGFRVDTAYWSNVGQYLEPLPQTTHEHDTQGDLYPEPLQYPNLYYDRKKHSKPMEWDGDTLKPRFSLLGKEFGGVRPMRRKEYPVYEIMMQNISAIGDAKTLHVMTSNVLDMNPHIYHDPEARRFFMPHYFEGAPRHTEAQWAKREEARAQQAKAENKGMGAY